MHIAEITWQHRNDFHFTCECEHCGHRYTRRDGYADAFFHHRVVPGQHCPQCGLNARGEKSAALD